MWRKRRDPRTDLRDTPLTNGSLLDEEKHAAFCFKILRWYFLCHNYRLHSSFFWGTLSKALEKSRIIKLFCIPEWRWLINSCVRVITYVSQLLLALKQCWQSTKMSLISRCFTMLDTTMCSNTLQQMQVKDTDV